MRRVRLIAAGCVLALLVLLALSGPVMGYFGVRPPFYFVIGSGGVRFVRTTVDPASLPPLLPGTPTAPATGARPVIVDTDMATDDWMAILFLLQRPDVEVLAITVVGTGEAHCAAGVRNALDLAALAGRPEIPVACGEEDPLPGGHSFPQAWRERVDGVLGLSLPRSPQPAYPGSAVELVDDLLQQSGRTADWLALGPLTNVAEALLVVPGLAGRLEGITVMGGAVDVPGNVAASGVRNTVAEWNIYADPRAAAIVLGSGVPVTLIPLDATRHVPVTPALVKKLKRNRQTPAAEFIYRVLVQKESDVRNGAYYFWDPLAAAVLVDGGLAQIEELALAVVEEEGPQSGRTARAAAGHRVLVATGVDTPAFEALFLDGINGRRP